jgi:predicted ArsR family transcriptional regulator
MQIPRNSREQIIFELKRAGSLTAKELSGILQISATAVRQLLNALQADALVASRPEKQAQGRPHHVFSLTSKGNEIFPKAYDVLLVDILETMRELGGDDMVNEIMKKHLAKKEKRYREAVAGGESLEERLAGLSKLRKDEGYMSEVVGEVGESRTLMEHNCPVLSVAKAHPSMCAYEIALMERVLGIKLEHTQNMVDGEHVCCFKVAEDNLQEIETPSSQKT